MQVCRSTGSLSWVAACGPLAGALALAISALAAPAVRAETPVWFEVHLVPQFGPNRIPIGLGPRPARRQGYAASFDGQGILVFGGRDGAAIHGDTWRWNGYEWKQLTAVGSGLNMPSPRYDAAMTYDGTRVVLHGGRNAATTFDDTYVWNGSQWSRLAALGTPPGRRHSHAMTFDGARVILLGGMDGGTAIRVTDVWRLAGSTWERISTIGMADNAKNIRVAPGLVAYDATGHRLVLFGGGGPFLVPQRDTWLIDTDDGAWVPCTRPSCTQAALVARSHPGMTYDEDQQRVVLHGGFALAGGALSDTWTFDGLDWSPAATAERPAGRGGHVLAYDPIRRRSATFAGAANRASTGADVPNDTVWEFYRVGHAGCLDDEDCASGICVLPPTPRGTDPRTMVVQGVCCEEYCGACERCDTGGRCRIAAGASCRGEKGCDGVCSEAGRCRYPGPEQRCGTCLACSAITGRCDQMPRDPEDPSCERLWCDKASHQCRDYQRVRRCVAPGQCATRWAHCAAFTNKPDGTPCNCYGGECHDVCAGGFCDRQWGDPQ